MAKDSFEKACLKFHKRKKTDERCHGQIAISPKVIEILKNPLIHIFLMKKKKFLVFLH